uniref:Uncharacterized protein n=1 Tax=Kalanchoe fedtschenkoi TaxID=63787 RepID=A0A7N0TYL0_KALFE
MTEMSLGIWHARLVWLAWVWDRTRAIASEKIRRREREVETLKKIGGKFSATRRR